MNEHIATIEGRGHSIYYPARDTDQNDPIGYRICIDNMNAIHRADEIHIFYDKASTGSLFDLGVAFAFGKKLVIVNGDEIEITEGKSFANMIRKWEKETRNIEPGDFVRYTVKNELGLVDEVTEQGARCWYHLGGTRAMTSFDLIERIDPPDALHDDFSNNYARASLIERRYRLLHGGDVSDLIDHDDISEFVRGLMNQ